jgi:CRP-like cAMP-binding protein
MEDLGDAERTRLVERFGRRFSAGDVLYREGEAADACYILQEGRIRLVKRVRSADRSLSVLRPGDLLGEDALLNRADRAASAIALTDVTVLALDQTTFSRLLSGNPDVATRMVRQLVRRLRDAEEQLENTMLRDHPSRVVNTLIRLASTTEKGAEGYALAVSPLDLSSRASLDVDAVKRAVQQLRDGGYLRIVDEKIVIPDLGALRQLYELLGMKEEVRGD